MSGQASDDELREMALNRGLRLIKSRRRKPGTGDFGKFGLTDGEGNKLFGFGADGLEASGQDIEAYLRAGSLKTWARSAESTPKRAPPANRSSSPSEGISERAARAGKARKAGSRAERSAAATATAKGEMAATSGKAQARSAKVRRAGARERSPSATPRKTSSTGKSEEETLIFRTAKPSDAGEIARFLSRLGIEVLGGAGAIAGFRGTKGSVRIARRGPVVGCIAWCLVATLQRGTIGRISLLLVDERHRRHGIGRKLLEDAAEALADRGCKFVEVLSDIEIRNSHGFLRSCGFEQTSYRFLRSIEAPPKTS